MSHIGWLDPLKPLAFPPTSAALDEPNGLLAAGGDLSPTRLLAAYSRGIFPWYSAGEPILWWTPSPRLVLRPGQHHIGRTLRKLLNKERFKITVDQRFSEVIQQCANIARDDAGGTWITEEMQAAYIQLHKLGFAHSIEAWQDDTLVGGLYGIHMGKVFFGESMFSAVSGASKVAFATFLNRAEAWGFQLIDCQVYTEHLASFGAEEISRDEFEQRLQLALPEHIDTLVMHPEQLATQAGSLHRAKWSECWASGQDHSKYPV